MIKHKNPLLLKPAKQGSYFLEDIKKIILNEFTDITEDQLQMKTRRPEIVFPRQLAHRLAKHFTNVSLSEIGQKFGQKDHATVLHSCRTIDNLSETDAEVREKYNNLFHRTANAAVLKSRGIYVCTLCGSSDLYAQVTMNLVSMRIVTDVDYNNVSCKTCLEQVQAIPEIDYKIENGLI